MEWWVILLIVLGAVILLGLTAYLSFCFYISSMMADKMCKPKHFKTKEEKQKEVEGSDGLNEYKRVPIEFKMSDGYIIHGDYSLNNPNKFVICMHGHISNREGSPKYAYAFYRLGYSVVFYDHRSHGDNERSIVTMTYQESKDALEIIDQVREKFGQDIELGLFGCSMGGATALTCAKDRQDLAFVVSDCGFASLEELTKSFIEIHHSPMFPILGLTNWFIKKRYHFSFKDASPMAALKENKKVPILLIQGKDDDLVFPRNAEYLYNACAAPKELEYFEGATHCNSIVADKDRYYKVIEDFINKYKRS